jgi:hypothetical protein
VYYSPRNIALQNSELNQCQVFCPSSIVKSLEVIPTAWGLVKVTLWYESEELGLINTPLLGEGLPINYNPTTDTVSETDSSGSGLSITGTSDMDIEIVE